LIEEALILWIALASAGLGATANSPALYGHRLYQVVEESQVVSVGKYRSTGHAVRLLPGAAAAFLEMREDGRRNGIDLVPISGFRSFTYQKRLFEREIKEYGSPERAARWYAPPGYSEHHTGLALDIADQAHPECDLEPCFENTRAYDWLTKNAPRFGFELSFPKNGDHVAFEPWHWRFVGDPESLKLFRRR
jgi:LAS superfamily LD-carboxypeptidase LdcB